MYLSRVQLDVRKQETMRALASPQVIHGAVEAALGSVSALAGERKRQLWRIDRVADKCYLLLLSPEVPNLFLLANQFGLTVGASDATKSYKPLLDKIRPNQRWHFRLLANPVRSTLKDSEDRMRRGKIHAHVTSAQQKEWLLSRAQTGGFALAEDEFEVVHTEWKKFRKSAGAHEVVLRTATYEGILSVSDAERFTDVLTSGIGRAKAYGCGLLTIMRIREV